MSKEWIGEEGYKIPMNVTEDSIKEALEEEREDR